MNMHAALDLAQHAGVLAADTPEPVADSGGWWPLR